MHQTELEEHADVKRGKTRVSLLLMVEETFFIFLT